jgi:NAD(P)-dependent dehydrogenase (short-subunit alcohol dehydrogenase family)
MTKSESTEAVANKSVLVTGANSGLGFEAAAQLAAAGYGRVILACRSMEKAENARQALVARVGSDPFECLEVDVSSISSAKAASAELIRRGKPLDALLLNAGMVSGDKLNKSVDGLEIAFASSIIGHHVLTLALLEADMLASGARVVIAGSEAARNDLPGMMDMKLYDFATEQPHEFGENLHDAMLSFAKGAYPERFNPSRYYAMTKLFVSWWSAAMARRFGDRISVFAVSPGSNMGTNAGRHVGGFKGFIFTKVMPHIGGLMGMSMPVAKGAKRYLDVLDGVSESYVSGKTYTSRPKKLVGPMEAMSYEHLLDVPRQEVAWTVLDELTGSMSAPN